MSFDQGGLFCKGLPVCQRQITDAAKRCVQFRKDRPMQWIFCEIHKFLRVGFKINNLIVIANVMDQLPPPLAQHEGA